MIYLFFQQPFCASCEFQRFYNVLNYGESFTTGFLEKLYRYLININMDIFKTRGS
jgi:hypothetical protein